MPSHTYHPHTYHPHTCPHFMLPYKSGPAVVLLVITGFLRQGRETQLFGDPIAVVALPEFEFLLDVIGHHLLLRGSLQSQEVDLVPLAEVLLNTEVSEHVAAEEGEVVPHCDPAVKHLRHLAGSDGSHNQFLEVVLLVFQFQQESHGVMHQLIILIPLCPPWNLHVDLEVRLHDDRTLQQSCLTTAVHEGEVPQVLTHCEVPLPHTSYQPDTLQLPDDLLLLLSHGVLVAGVRQGETEDVSQDLMVLGASFVGQEALDEDGDLVPQGESQEVEVLPSQSPVPQSSNPAFLEDLIAFVPQESQQVEELLLLLGLGGFGGQFLAVEGEGGLDVVVELAFKCAVEGVERVLKARSRDDLQFLQISHGGIEAIRSLLSGSLFVHGGKHLLLLEGTATGGHAEDEVLCKLIEGAEETPRHHRHLDQLGYYRVIVPVHLPDYLPYHYYTHTTHRHLFPPCFLKKR